MKKDRFTFVCNETEEGRDSFVIHQAAKEEGRVLECSLEHVIVETADGGKRCWDYQDVDEVSRSREEWPYR